MSGIPAKDEVTEDDQKIAATTTGTGSITDGGTKEGDNFNTVSTVDMDAEEVSETMQLTSDQQMIYNAAHIALNESLSEFLPAPIPRVVSVDLIQQVLTAPSLSTQTQTAVTTTTIQDSITINAPAAGSTPAPSGGTSIYNRRTSSLSLLNRDTSGVGGDQRNEILHALDELEGLEKEEQNLAYTTSLTRYLTELLTGQTYENSTMAIKSLDALEEAVPRRVCQHPFRKNDIVWVCRTCQADETCVLCHACFSQSNHDGHDVAFYHAQAGGCCDCGDPDAWNPSGFCPRHGPNASAASESSLPESFTHRVRGVVPACIDWMVQTIASNAETAYDRANPEITIKRTTPTNDRERVSFSSNVVASATSILTTPTAAPSIEGIDVDDDDIIMNDDAVDGAVTAELHQENTTTNNNLMNDIYVDEYDFVLEERSPRHNHNHMMHHHRSHVFSPMAASNSQQSVAARQEQEEATAAAIALGNAGRVGHGLFLVLHADDIHSTQQFADALKDFYGTILYHGDTLVNQLVRALRLYGQLVIWGTMELAQECGTTQVHLWLDGDKVAAGRIGGIVLQRAGRLRQHGIFCSILTRDELILEQRAVAVLQWLSYVARSCDPLCLTVAECILPNRHLVPLLRADFKMSARVTKAWYSLLLTLLAVPTFKSHLAAAYCDTYRDVTSKYARGMGVLERSGYTLSVQFLNRVTYVLDLVEGRDLLGKLGKSLFETLVVAVRTQNAVDRLDPNHFILTHRRYSPCISDFKCVLNVDGMSRVIAARGGTFLTDWIATLSLAQFMDTHKWRHWTLGHVEDESRGWVGAFNLSISLGGLFERILCWTDETTSPIKEGPLSGDLMSCVELTFHLLTNGIDPWHRKEIPLYSSNPVDLIHGPHIKALVSLPFSTIAASFGSALEMSQIPISQVTPFSFHLPLHRFLASCIRELCLRHSSRIGDITDLFSRLKTQLSDEQQKSLFEGLMEFPVLVLSRSAQIRAGLWRRNGSGLNDQVLNYAEPPFCRHMRDADILLIQFATVGRRAVSNQSDDLHQSTSVGMSSLVNLLLHRFELFDFLGFTEALNLKSLHTSQDPDGLYEDDKNDDGRLLTTVYSPANDAGLLMSLLEEFLHFIIMFVSELPQNVPRDKEDHTRQAKLRLFREVVHRLSSGQKTHSELSEVHHVLSHWDNYLLSEEGKMVNPDDATGAALATTLEEVAERKVSRGKMEPDKWELKRSAWEYYDPAFFHISLRNHQTAASEGRPKPVEDLGGPFGWEAKPYAPVPNTSHPFFARLRRDATSDATLLSIAYKVLHIHCRVSIDKSIVDLQGKLLYESGEKSETALARAIHFFTLGAYAWNHPHENGKTWREHGGGSVGSMFFHSTDDFVPDAATWVKRCLLADPSTLLDCSWYSGEDTALILLERLATGGGIAGRFVAQDSAVRAGAAWLCEFALSCCPGASEVLHPVKKTSAVPVSPATSRGSEIELRKQAAKEKAMAKMKAQAAKFSAMLEGDVGSEDESDHNASKAMPISAPSTPGTPNRAVRLTSFGSTFSSVSSFEFRDASIGGVPNSIDIESNGDYTHVPPRLLQNRPRCIICNDEDGVEGRLFCKSDDDDGEGQRKKSRRRTEHALGFVGYAQASVVLKGGGGPPPELASPYSSVYEFVGTHVALCGHAVHSECCESYLATVSHREDRQIGKRDEFRCPLCQRLSNCLMPFIDVGMDWIEPPSTLAETVVDGTAAETTIVSCDKKLHVLVNAENPNSSLHNFLQSTPWWVSRRNGNVTWDGHSAFVENMPSNPDDDEVSIRKPSRIRSLRKKDLYQAWNAMMHTPRFVRRKLRRSSSRVASNESEARPMSFPNGEESTGETVVWRRFMDQISDISYRADTKRLGDDHLHDLFGEFRHYIVEKYAYSTRRPVELGESTDWPSCLYTETLSENRRQEMSREKLMSKLLLSIQAFTYSCSSEAFEAKRSYRKSLMLQSEVAMKSNDYSVESVRSKFGFRDLACSGKMIIMPVPSPDEDGDSWPFDGRLGKLRYFGLTVMAASGAVAADLVQLVLQLPFTKKDDNDPIGDQVENPLRAPITYPLLFGNVVTHVVAAMCATCGRARARSDLLDVVWPIPFSIRGSFAFLDLDGNTKNVDSVVDDCEGFMKIGLIARILQVLLGKLMPGTWMLQVNSSWIDHLNNVILSVIGNANVSLAQVDLEWIRLCVKLVGIAVSPRFYCATTSLPTTSTTGSITFNQLREACLLAVLEAGSYLIEVGTIFQILVPGAIAKYAPSEWNELESSEMSSLATLQYILTFFHFESIDAMIDSELIKEIVAGWYDTVYENTRLLLRDGDDNTDLQSRLYRTQGFRVYDWPIAYTTEQNLNSTIINPNDKDTDKARYKLQQQPQDDVIVTSPITNIPMIENLESQNVNPSIACITRSEMTPSLLTFQSKKSVSLLGGFSPDLLNNTKLNRSPRVRVIPTSYTDLYAELASLMPDCEQTAVCLICGEVLNAGGRGECTKHSFKCGAGAGIFFLLQECSGLLLHKARAAYIHSPYVDSHGETPQYRGRPLNLDVNRYEHLREVWYSHGVRQKVLAERGIARQVILPEYY